MNRISLPLMDSIETSPKINRINTATLPRTIRPHTGDSSDSDSESDTAPLGDTFITRYIYSCMVANKQCCIAMGSRGEKKKTEWQQQQS